MYNFPSMLVSWAYQQALEFVHKAHSPHILLGCLATSFPLEVLIAKIFVIFVHFAFVSNSADSAPFLAHLCSEPGFLKEIRILYLLYYSFFFFLGIWHISLNVPV